MFLRFFICKSLFLTSMMMMMTKPIIETTITVCFRSTARKKSASLSSEMTTKVGSRIFHSWEECRSSLGQRALHPDTNDSGLNVI